MVSAPGRTRSAAAAHVTTQTSVCRRHRIGGSQDRAEVGACRQLSGRRLLRLSPAPGVTDRWERKLRAAPQKGAAFTVCRLEIRRENAVSVAPGVGSPLESPWAQRGVRSPSRACIPVGAREGAGDDSQDERGGWPPERGPRGTWMTRRHRPPVGAGRRQGSFTTLRAAFIE